MQSNKASSKKTRQIAEKGNTAAPEVKGASVEATPKTRDTKSSMVKKNDGMENTPAKRHRKTGAATYTENVAPVATAESTPAPKAMAASAGAGSSFSVRPAPFTSQSAKPSASRDEIAQLAHSYWEARGDSHGNPEEDWLRAERELLSKR
ncbi:MAG: DUF2934 domain-containing protein [Bryobacteraceae bacterium]